MAPPDGGSHEQHAHDEGRVNLSAWALRHQALVLFFIVALAVAGALAYRALGRAEDPPFTFKVMVVTAFWPGATADETMRQVTDKLEKKLQDVPYYDKAISFTRAGETTIQVVLKDTTPPKAVPESWYQVRKRIGDIRQTLPAGVIGPFYNDEFGDTFGTIFAFSGDGCSPRWAFRRSRFSTSCKSRTSSPRPAWSRGRPAGFRFASAAISTMSSRSSCCRSMSRAARCASATWPRCAATTRTRRRS